MDRDVFNSFGHDLRWWEMAFCVLSLTVLPQKCCAAVFSRDILMCMYVGV